MPPDPPRRLTPLALEKRLPPTFPVGMSTSKVIDSTGSVNKTDLPCFPVVFFVVSRYLRPF